MLRGEQLWCRLLILGEFVVRGALVASDRAIRGDPLGTPPALGAALLGEGRGQSARARQQPAGVRFVSSWGLSDTRFTPATEDTSAVWAPGESRDGAGGRKRVRAPPRADSGR